jgi:hypothetical protein
MTPLLFIVPAIIVVAIFALTWQLFGRLEAYHSEKYEELGSPSFHGVKNKGFGPIFATLLFIVRREHRGLADSYLSIVSDAMLVCFVVYILLFAYVIYYTNAHHLWRGSAHAT